jgi:hypothetical protein
MRPASDEATMINHVRVTNVARQQENPGFTQGPPGVLNPGLSTVRILQPVLEELRDYPNL